jgi:hydroxyacylglutathione hydrolase
VPIHVHYAEDQRFDTTKNIIFDDFEFVFGDNVRFKILHTPGHTMGGLCFLFNDAIFTGDTLFNEGVGVAHEKYGGNPETLYDTIQCLKNTITGQTRVFPGHIYGLPVGIRFESLKNHNIYLSIKEKNQFVDFRTKTMKKYGF